MIFCWRICYLTQLFLQLRRWYHEANSRIFGIVSFFADGQLEGDSVHYADEKHLKNVRQLTYGGDNAEAYWSYDGTSIVFQRTSVKNGLPCDQIFVGRLPQSTNERFTYKLICTSRGQTTCAFFMKDGKHVVYASTHKGGDECPPVPDRAKYGNRYIWPIYASFDILWPTPSGHILRQLTDEPGYDAEATISPNGKKILFCSNRNNGGTHDTNVFVADWVEKHSWMVNTQLLWNTVCVSNFVWNDCIIKLVCKYLILL